MKAYFGPEPVESNEFIIWRYTSAKTNLVIGHIEFNVLTSTYNVWNYAWINADGHKLRFTTFEDAKYYMQVEFDTLGYKHLPEHYKTLL